MLVVLPLLVLPLLELLFALRRSFGKTLPAKRTDYSFQCVFFFNIEHSEAKLQQNEC